MTTITTHPDAPTEPTPALAGRGSRPATVLRRRLQAVRAARAARRTDRSLAAAISSASTPAHRDELLLLDYLNER